ncbi:unnamed protein product [Ectocarpus sp. CCAP 1310/34]|nr:unnamed protein product [Ectocarpus sp. CCAP 1310/34]
MKTSMATLNILQNHYPETLGHAFFISPPVFFKGFWKARQLYFLQLVLEGRCCCRKFSVNPPIVFFSAIM